MQQFVEFLVSHSAQVVEILLAIAAVVVAVIALTPTKADDAALAGFLSRISPTRKAVGSTAVAAAIAALSALFLGGCAHMKQVGVAAAEDARSRACIDIETRCVDRMEAGDMTLAEAQACVSCTRATCDAVSERVRR
jgi:hypothetical protein